MTLVKGKKEKKKPPGVMVILVLQKKNNLAPEQPEARGFDYSEAKKICNRTSSTTQMFGLFWCNAPG